MMSFGLKRSHQQLPIPNAEQPPPKIQNSFCNDGSFLDHFKKILEKHEIANPPPPPVAVVDAAATEKYVELYFVCSLESIVELVEVCCSQCFLLKFTLSSE